MLESDRDLSVRKAETGESSTQVALDLRNDRRLIVAHETQTPRTSMQSGRDEFSRAT